LYLPEKKLESLVMATIKEGDSDGDGKISKEEYIELTKKYPNMLSNM
jgi:hypothetical protein